MQGKIRTIYWVITAPKPLTDKDLEMGGRTGTVLPHMGESWPHMVRFLKQTGPTEFLTAYQIDERGNTVHYHEMDFETGNAKDAEMWFLDK